MLVLTIQDKRVAQLVRGGEYKADFWKSRFACASPRFTKGFLIIKKLLFGTVENKSTIPIFAWGGTPFIDSIRDNRDKEAIFLEVPEEYLVFSDYDKFCDYVQGDSDSTDFVLSSRKAKERIKRGYCVQVCMPFIKPEWVLSMVDFSYIEKFDGSVDDCYRYCNLLKSYFLLSSRVEE